MVLKVKSFLFSFNVTLGCFNKNASHSTDFKNHVLFRKDNYLKRTVGRVGLFLDKISIYQLSIDFFGFLKKLINQTIDYPVDNWLSMIDYQLDNITDNRLSLIFESL